MAIARVVGGHAASTSVTFTAGYAVGNIIIMLALNTSSSTIPTIPSGWTSITSVSDSTNGLAMVSAYIVATSTSQASGTWTNATALSYSIYSGQASTSPITNPAGQTGTTTTISYSGITTMTQAGGASTSWVIEHVGVKGSTSTAYSAAPTSMSLVPNTSTYFAGPPAYEVDTFDTNAGVASYAFNSKTLAAAAPWLSKTFELNAAAAAATNTGQFFAYF